VPNELADRIENLDLRLASLYSFAAFTENALVAQLVEQGPLKPKVLGSIPSQRTTKKRSIH
jgi:hypothetical protein